MAVGLDLLDTITVGLKVYDITGSQKETVNVYSGCGWCDSLTWPSLQIVSTRKDNLISASIMDRWMRAGWKVDLATKGTYLLQALPPASQPPPNHRCMV